MGFLDSLEGLCSLVRLWPTKEGWPLASAAAAREIADSEALLCDTVRLLERDIYSNSVRDSAKSKRRFVLDLAELVLDKCSSTHSVRPLTKVLVTKVAACLKGAYYTTGSSYRRELKYEHVERSFEVPGWLSRVLDQCER